MERFPRLLLVPWLFAASEAFAQAPLENPYALRPEVDLPVMILASTAWAVSPLAEPSCPCSASEVRALDRWSAGRRSHGLDLVSDMGLGLAVAAPFVLGAVATETHDADWAGYGRDAVIMSEAMLVSGALTRLARVALHRPRPHVYDRPADDPIVRDPGSYGAFPSAHVATVFAAGLSAARTHTLHHPGEHEVALYGTALLAGSAMGILRVLSGEDFTTDVLAGAAIGAAAGLLIPRLHARTAGGSPESGAPQESAGPQQSPAAEPRAAVLLRFTVR